VTNITYTCLFNSWYFSRDISLRKLRNCESFIFTWTWTSSSAVLSSFPPYFPYAAQYKVWNTSSWKSEVDQSIFLETYIVLARWSSIYYKKHRWPTKNLLRKCHWKARSTENGYLILHLTFAIAKTAIHSVVTLRLQEFFFQTRSCAGYFFTQFLLAWFFWGELSFVTPPPPGFSNGPPLTYIKHLNSLNFCTKFTQLPLLWQQWRFKMADILACK
jgi:hypothetical protein